MNNTADLSRSMSNNYLETVNRHPVFGAPICGPSGLYILERVKSVSPTVVSVTLPPSMGAHNVDMQLASNTDFQDLLSRLSDGNTYLAAVNNGGMVRLKPAHKESVSNQDKTLLLTDIEILLHRLKSNVDAKTLYLLGHALREYGDLEYARGGHVISITAIKCFENALRCDWTQKNTWVSLLNQLKTVPIARARLVRPGGDEIVCDDLQLLLEMASVFQQDHEVWFHLWEVVESRQLTGVCVNQQWCTSDHLLGLAMRYACVEHSSAPDYVKARYMATYAMKQDLVRCSASELHRLIELAIQAVHLDKGCCLAWVFLARALNENAVIKIGGEYYTRDQCDARARSITDQIGASGSNGMFPSCNIDRTLLNKEYEESVGLPID